MQIIQDPTLTFNQRFTKMAKAAENSIDPIELSPQAQAMVDLGVVWDMGEGCAPFRPRYIVPDYARFMESGSEFLMLDAPRDIWEAVHALMILYHHVPSASGTPVYVGYLDALLDPFVQDRDEAKKAIRALLTHLDRTIPDAFCHCDLGPRDTEAGRIILELTEEMQRPVPNMTLVYSEETSDEFALKAIETGLATAKPSFANQRLYGADWPDGFGVASCYNVLPMGGGGYTLGRLNLKTLAAQAAGVDDFFASWLPKAAAAQCEQMDKRIRFMVDEAGFFKTSFLVKEGLIHQDRFVGMCGMVGLAECVNTLLNADATGRRFGQSDEADDLAARVLDELSAYVEGYEPKYGRFYLHAQVGVDNDVEVTPGTRIPVRDEVELPRHLAVTARMQRHFPTGTGELYPMDETVRRNPQYVLDIIKGAFAMDMRYFSFYNDDSDVIRVTGYLVKRSDVEKLRRGEAVLENATVLGMGAFEAGHFLERQVRGASRG